MPNASSSGTPHAFRTSRALLGAALAALMLTAVIPAPAAAAEASLPPLGMSIGSIAGLKAAGAAPKYGSYWVGDWMASSGWGGFDSAMKTAKAEGVTPVVYWYYWGDSISPGCFDADGCDGRTESEWYSLTDQLVSHLKSTLGGAEVLIVLENEFNKGGITGTYAPTFDAKLEKVALKLNAVSGAKLIVGFGNWGEDKWSQFPKTIAQSEYVGFQMMRASTKDSEASYYNAANRTVALTNYVAKNFNKPSFLYDVALSSYPDETFVRLQAKTLDAIFQNLVSSGASTTGLQGVVYRSLNDHYMSPANYYGYAESHWGLRTKDGVPKPAFDVWVKHAKGVVSEPAPAQPNVPGSFEAEKMTATKGGLKSDGSASGNAAWNLWANGHLSTTLVSEGDQSARISVRAYGQSAGGVDARMEVRLGSATLAAFTVPEGGYRAFDVDATIPSGSSTLSIAFTNDGIIGSEDRNLIVDVVSVGPAPAPAPANAAPKAAFDCAADGLAVSCDASSSSDADGDDLSYEWSFGDGTSATGVSPEHAYAESGDYVVKLAVSDGEDIATATRTIAVVRPNAGPVAAFAATATYLSATFDASGSSDADGDALGYAWSFGDGKGATGQSVGHEYAAPGTYSVTLRVSDGKLDDTQTRSLVVSYPAPVAKASASGTNATRGFDGSGSSDPAGGVLTYAWSFGDGATASGATTSHTFAPGNYTVTLTVTNRFGESDKATIAVSVAAPPPAPAPAPAPKYAATFTPVNGNAHWVQVKVDANQKTSAVCVRVNGGTCQKLTLRSWGDWAAAMKVPSTARVTYTATSSTGEKVTSDVYLGSSSKLAPEPMTATFTPHDGNDWWVQAKVASNRAIASVCASVNGGACQQLSLRSWGSWAASFYVPAGSKVTFTAKATTGESVTSSVFVWPVK